jgi:PAS domain S-box-containing protein
MHLPKNSLISRLVVSFLGVSLMTVLIVGFMSYERARSALKSAVYDQLNATIELKEDALNRWLDQQLDDLIFIKTQPAVQRAAELLLREEDPERLSHAYNTLFGVFQILFVNMQDFSDIALLSSKGGEVVVSSRLESVGDFRVSDTYFIEGLKGPYIQEIYLSPVTFKPTITVASPVYDHSGQSMGVLAANLDMDRLDDIILERSGLGKTGESYLVDSTNTFVTGEGFGRAEFPRGAHSAGINRALDGQSGTGLYRNYAGVPVVGAFKWVENRQLAIMAEISQSEAFAPARNLDVEIGIVGCLMSLLLTTVVNIIARRIASPILAVRSAAEKITDGDRSIRAPIIREDEIGDLARSFNLMVDEIQESENRYRLLADNVSDVIWTMDMDMKLTYVSPSTLHFRGYSPEEVRAQNLDTMMTPGSLQKVQAVLKEELSLETRSEGDPQRSRTIEIEFMHRDGHVVWGEVVIGFIRDQYGDAVGIMGATRDITERKLAENKLRESEERMQTVFKMTPGVIVISRVHDKVIVDVNEEFTRVTGYSKEEVVGQSVLKLGLWEDFGEREEFVGKIMKDGIAANFEFNFQAKDNQVRIGLLSGAVVQLSGEPHLIFGAQDITEIKDAQRALQESEDKFRTIFVTSPDSVSISSLEDGKFVDVNEGFERLTGYSREEALNMKATDLWVDTDIRREIMDKLAKDGEIHNWEGLFKIKDGQFRTGLISASIVVIGDRKYVLGVHKDITARKETESLLLSTQYSIDTSNIVVLWVKPDSRLAYVNDAACRHFGFTREELLTMSVPDIDPDWTSDYWNREGWEKVKKGGKLTFESRNRHKDGTILPVEASTSYFEFDGEEYVFAFIQDITERKGALDALRESEEKYRLLAENVSDVIWVWDQDLKPTYYSPSVMQLRGVTSEEAINQSFEDFLTPESHRAAMEMMERELAFEISGKGLPSSKTLSMELQMIRKDKSHIWTEINMRLLRDDKGAFSGVVGVTRDITRRKVAEQALRESEERYRVLFNAGSDAVFAHGLGPDGMPSNFYTVNDVACEMLGRSKSELMEMTPDDISKFRDRGELGKIVQRLLKEKRLIFESTFINSGGGEVPVEISAHVFDLYENPAIISIARDVTDRKRLDEEKARIQTKLIQANKMTSLGLMVSSLAHEINNPNNTIMFNLRRFAKTWDDILPILNDYYEEHGDFNVGGVSFSELSGIFPRLISGTLESSELIKAIIENLKGFVRQSTDTLDFNVDVNDVVRRAVSLLESQVRKGVGRLQVELAEDLPRTRGNPQKLIQVMVNLISNALESLTGDKQGIRISSSFDSADSMLKLTIADEGEGMTEEQIASAMEPFYTTKIDSGGTGLGLTITKMLLDEHGADLFIESTPGQGATVTVALKVDMGQTVH